ncbi:Uba4p SCDLUD_003201 [Saccharomycodes ludwigii]|uniref:Uba4p n=1 Tax=Saccharomycodes ludwigii TaxID=36035 RepID=UPI001E878473|nr:hypothetical protein SCDLUD_003201 [Saccharomycodes ludwigii]KAH3900230.1 hypothetical protein SCDLUD_003201 [Saccharomycodes ludwigii]
MAVNSDIDELKKEIEKLKLENANLRKNATLSANTHLPISIAEYSRYGRQMICEESNGIEGQLKLKNSKVLFIGAGGLACPALAYLAGAGIGHIGIVDDDVVENSNLHRQILHDSTKVGMLKCESAKEYITKLNPHINVTTHPVRLDNYNAFNIFKQYDIILDCTDTPITRYLISDVSVNCGKVVVSASGVGTEGQLCILNFADVGPCYRCFYPTPPPPNTVSSCSDGGVIGPCIGLVGVMMAVETMKLILGVYTVENFKPFLLQYCGFPNQTLRSFKMRYRQATCACCGDAAHRKISQENIESGEINYGIFCGSKNYDVCQSSERLNIQDFYNDYYRKDQKANGHLLLDVRPRHHYQISHLPNSYNVTVKELKQMNGDLTLLKREIPEVNKDSEIIVICRRGNDSRLATRLLKDQFEIPNVKDVIGGFFRYIDEIDPQIPKY